MTLSSFKSKFNLSSVLILLILYGVGSYSLGRFSIVAKISQDFIKGTSTQKSFKEPIQSPIPYADTQSAKIISSSVKLCANTFYSFEVAYPKEWFTTYNTEKEQCIYFAPYSFVLPQVPEEDFVPITVKPLTLTDWPDTVKFYENPNDLQNIVYVETITAGGLPIQKIKSTSTGRGAIPRGYEKLSYLVFNSKTPLIFTYQQLDDKDNVSDFEKNLEEVVQSLRFY